MDSSSSAAFQKFKEIEYESEGIKSTEKFVLFDFQSLPFVTYLPDKNWSAAQTDDGAVIRHGDLGFIKIVFIRKGIPPQEARKEYNKIVENISGSDISKFEEEEKPQWAVSSLYLWKENKENGGGSTTWAVLGLHEKQYFCVCTHYTDNVENDFPLLQAIFREWRWKDTKDSFDGNFVTSGMHTDGNWRVTFPLEQEDGENK